jgi:hypothetical protein
VLGGELAGALDGFLRFHGKFVPTDGHGDSLLSYDSLNFLSWIPIPVVILSEARNRCNGWRAKVNRSFASLS